MSSTLRRIVAVAAIGGAGLLLAGAQPALAHGNTTTNTTTHGNSNHTGPGDNNRGDVWVDTVGQPAGPGHEMDPHLPCANVNLWGADMGDSTDPYTIDSWPPSGTQTVAYNSTWHYNVAQGGTQLMDVIDVQTLVANARAAGAAPVNKQGYHFKLQLTQDPQKHKTFWVACLPPEKPSTPTPTPTPTPTATPTGTPSATATPTPSAPGCTPSEANEECGPTPVPGCSPSEENNECGMQTPTPSPSGGVQGICVDAQGHSCTDPHGGVQGISTSSPVTGAAIALGTALLLIAIGGLLVLIARRRGSGGQV